MIVKVLAIWTFLSIATTAVITRWLRWMRDQDDVDEYRNWHG